VTPWIVIGMHNSDTNVTGNRPALGSPRGSGNVKRRSPDILRQLISAPKKEPQGFEPALAGDPGCDVAERLALGCDQRSAVVASNHGDQHPNQRSLGRGSERNNMMLRLSHNRVIVLDRRRTNLTLLSTGFANTADDKGNDFEIRHNGSLSTDHVTGLPGCPRFCEQWTCIA
jgi:hypothetical protein